MKIAIYSPYLDTAGGGEKYMLSIAEILSEKHKVDVLLDSNLSQMKLSEIKDKNEQRLSLNLSSVNFIPAPIGPKSSILNRAIFLKKYEWFFLNSDGSIFYSSAKNNIVHFQIPFTINNKKSLWIKFKTKSWEKAIYNSKFTQKYIEQNWNIKGEVIYPPIDVEKFHTAKKKKQIITVGRFNSVLKIKKHEFLIDTFKQLVDQQKDKDLSLHIAGGLMESEQGYIEKLRIRAKGYKIFFYPNIEISELIKLYSESSIYWHAAGYEESEPEKFEHFGITTVEAMASGCIPIVINKGGQIEIVTSGENGFLWETKEELKSLTIKVIKDQKLQETLSKAAQEKSKNFSKNIFKKKILSLVGENND